MYKVLASRTSNRREVVQMELFTFQDVVLFATFVISLLAYIDKKNKRKQINSPMYLASAGEFISYVRLTTLCGGCSFLYNYINISCQ